MSWPERGPSRGMNQPLILGIDSAGNGASIAVLRGGDVAAMRTDPRPHGQAEILMPTIAAARGLALATGSPAIGITRFDAVAAQFPPERRFGRALLVALDTRRGDFFLQLFRDRADEPFLASGDDAPRALPETPILLAGDAAHRLAPYVAGRDIRVADNPDRPLAADVARLAAVAYRDGVATPPRPLYLRAPDTTVPRREAAR